MMIELGKFDGRNVLEGLIECDSIVVVEVSCERAAVEERLGVLLQGELVDGFMIGLCLVEIESLGKVKSFWCRGPFF